MKKYISIKECLNNPDLIVPIARDAYARGHEKGLTEGITEGQREEKTFVIMNMTEKGYSLEDISSIINLPISEIENIISKSQKKK